MMNRHSTSWYLRRLALAVLVAAAAACGSLRRGGNPPPAVIYFTNESLYQASVYIGVPGVSARRIGTVFGGRTDTLLVPTDLAIRGGMLNVVARLFGRSGSAQTGPVSIHPGVQYTVTLPPDGRLLSFLPVQP